MATSVVEAAPAFPSFPAPSTPVASTQSQIVQAVQQTHGFTPRPHQIEALTSLLETGKDTILYAPTSAGKSLIAQVYPVLRPGWVLCIIPLTRLGDEQVRKINTFPGMQGFLLYDKTNTLAQRRVLLNALQTQRCTHGKQIPGAAVYFTDPSIPGSMKNTTAPY